jgi:recombinational DNA repair ATPase RecF
LAVRKSSLKKKLVSTGESFIKEKATVDNLTHTVRAMKNSESTWEYNHQLELQNIETDLAKYEAIVKEEMEELKTKSASFVDTKEAKLAELRTKLEETKFEPDAHFNDRLELLTDQIDKHQLENCVTCGQAVSGRRKELLSELESVKHSKWKNGVLREKAAGFLEQIHSLQIEANHYEDQILRLPLRKNPYELLFQTEKAKVNPYTSKLETFQNDLTRSSAKMVEQEALLTALKTDLSRLDQLYDMCPTLRAELLKMAINAIQEDTNNYLEQYFDSELRIEFTLDGDNLDVGVQKSGNSCSYKQLSKGQRQLLKLTFALAVMAASANQSGMKFENLFFDEALDGLDEKLKLKAFTLFESLESSYTSILLIDHAPAFQNMFAKKFAVGIEGDKSYIKEQHE